jgi:Uma2 family endonuclease
MSSATAGSGLTWENFLDLPDDPKYRHAELVDAELVLANPPTWLHQHVVMRLVVALELVQPGLPARCRPLPGGACAPSRRQPRRPTGQPDSADFVLTEELSSAEALTSPLLPGLSIPIAELAD